MWHEKKVIAWLLRDLTISRVHMQYKRLSPMPWYLPKARSLGIHRIHRPLYGANDRLIVVDTIGDVSAFLAAGDAFFNGVDRLLDQQISRLGTIERDVLNWLAIGR